MAIKDPEKRAQYYSKYHKQWYQEHKEYRKAQIRKRKKEIRTWMRSLRLACSKCGEDHPACLDFHHRDPKKKEFNLSSGMVSTYGYSKEKILREMEKCDVLCSNCHRKHHWRKFKRR